MFHGLDTTQFISRDYYETSSSISKIGLIFYLRGGARNIWYKWTSIEGNAATLFSVYWREGETSRGSVGLLINFWI